MARPTGRPVRDELLAGAQQLIQQVGVGSFSYGDLAELVGIRSPSIHHHFRRKEDLVAEVAAIYRSQFSEAVAEIEGATASIRIQRYADLFAETSARDMNCLCGALAAEWLTVGEAPRVPVEGFFADQIAWLKAELAAGAEAGEFSIRDVDETAQMVLAALEGAILMSRAVGPTNLPSTVGSSLVGLLTR